MLLSIMLLVSAVYYVFETVHWPLALDAPIMHYVEFLTRHGMRPYVDITDNNMPGAYYTEGLAMRIFGGSDIAWRVYDFFLLAVMTLGLIAIAKPYDWLAGLFAGCFFVALHGTEGPGFSVEREQVITVLLVLGYLALFRAVRDRRPLWMLLFGIANGVAASIKPTFLPLGFVLLGFAGFILWKRRSAFVTYVAWGLAGIVSVFAYDIGFLLHYHAIEGFVFILRHVLPAYSAFDRASPRHLLTAFDHKFMLLVAVAIPLAIVNWRKFGAWSWEKWAIATGVAVAGLSYFIQGKGFPHHRYTILVFTLLLVGIEILQAMRYPGWPRLVAVAACFFVILWALPRKMQALHRIRPESPFTEQLESDLRTLGGTAELQGKVQCFDLVYGCLNALYHLQLVENTGYTGDLLLFSDPNNPATQYYRKRWWQLAQSDPATVLVVSNEWFEQSNSYSKMDRWPEFERYLAANYTMAVERHFFMRQGTELMSGDTDPGERDSYRIYIRKGSAECPRAGALAP